MKAISLGGELAASQVGLGCMRLASLTVNEATRLLETANDSGINFYDHADIYGEGRCETVFGKALRASSIARENVLIQSKCGIRQGFYDFSKEHIIASVEGSLQRLQVDYLDVLVLHRPDTLMEPLEVAAAFDELEKSGKVRYFGVSNQNPMQVELLKQVLSQKLIVNQLQFGLQATGMIDAGIHVNMSDAAAINRDGLVLDYSRLTGMTIQAWSPYQYGMFAGTFLANPDFAEVNATIDHLAEKYQVSNTAIATAWITRHPANMQVLAGTMKPKRLQEIVEGAGLELSRPEWYELYRAAGNQLP